MNEVMTMETLSRKETKFNKLELAFSIAKILLLIIGALFLLISFSGQESSELYAVSNGTRYTVNEDYEFIWVNFFGRMSYLSREGFDPILEIIFLVVLAINVVVTLASMIPQAKILKKIYFAAIPLALVVLCIVVMVDGDATYVLDIEGPVYFEGLKVYLEEDVRFDMILVPSLIAFVFALIAHMTPNIIALIKNKKAKGMAENQLIENCVTEQAVTADLPKNKKEFEGSIPEELKKYKELLDVDAITQEEYDTKKKELLNL